MKMVGNHGFSPIEYLREISGIFGYWAICFIITVWVS